MRAGKIVAIVIGVIAVLIGLALVLPGGAMLWAHGTQRGGDGFYATSGRVLSTSSYAVTTPAVDLHVEPWEWLRANDSATVRIQAEATSEPLFLGIGPSDKVAQYLANVAHDQVTDVGGWFQTVDYSHVTGGAPLTVPGRQDFWAASQAGSGTLMLDWPLQGGNWTAVMMNADGSAGVASAVKLGGRMDILLPIGVGLSGAGFVFFAIGVVLIVLGARRTRPPMQAAPVLPAAGGVAGQQA